MQERDHDKAWLISFGVTLWVSFVAAAVATMLFFATFDPLEIANVATFSFELDRTSGYSIGFLLFWILLVVNSCVVNWLIKRDPSSKRNTPLEGS